MMMSMADIWCSRTDLEAQHCDGEEFQPQHRGVLSEKVIWCCLGLHTPCQCMRGDGGDSQHRVGWQIQRHKWCTWTPMHVRRQDQLRVSACIVGSLLFQVAPWKRHDLRNVIESAHQCKQIYAITWNWWIECALNTFSAVTWCSPVFTSSRMCEFLPLKNRK